MRYTKKQREMAALICDISASAADREVYANIAEDLGLMYDHPAVDLARSAWDSLWFRVGSPYHLEWTAALDAEAAQMVREGWNP